MFTVCLVGFVLAFTGLSRRSSLSPDSLDTSDSGRKLHAVMGGHMDDELTPFAHIRHWYSATAPTMAPMW
eukprot:2937210-Prymnesium_polylepis.1